MNKGTIAKCSEFIYKMSLLFFSIYSCLFLMAKNPCSSIDNPVLSSEEMLEVTGKLAIPPIAIAVCKSATMICFWNVVDIAGRECTDPIIIEIEDRKQYECQKTDDLRNRIQDLKYELLNLLTEKNSLRIQKNEILR